MDVFTAAIASWSNRGKELFEVAENMEAMSAQFVKRTLVPLKGEKRTQDTLLAVAAGERHICF